MLSKEIADILADHAFMWTKDGEPFHPLATDVKIILDEAVRMLYNEPTDKATPQYERGGIIVQKVKDNTYDVFVRIGEIS